MAPQADGPLVQGGTFHRGVGGKPAAVGQTSETQILLHAIATSSGREPADHFIWSLPDRGVNVAADRGESSRFRGHFQSWPQPSFWQQFLSSGAETGST